MQLSHRLHSNKETHWITETAARHGGGVGGWGVGGGGWGVDAGAGAGGAGWTRGAG